MKLRIQPVAVLVKLALAASWQIGYCADRFVSAEPSEPGAGADGLANRLMGQSRLRVLDESTLARLSLPQLCPSTAYCAAATHWTTRGSVVAGDKIHSRDHGDKLILRLDTSLHQERQTVAARVSMTEPIAPVFAVIATLGTRLGSLSDAADTEATPVRAADELDRAIATTLVSERSDALAQQGEYQVPSWLLGAGSLPPELQFEASFARAEAMLDRLSAARHPQLAQSTARDYTSWLEVRASALAHLSATRHQQTAQGSVHDDASWSELRTRALAWVQTQHPSPTAIAQTPGSPSVEPIAESADPNGPNAEGAIQPTAEIDRISDRRAEHAAPDSTGSQGNLASTSSLQHTEPSLAEPPVARSTEVQAVVQGPTTTPDVAGIAGNPLLAQQLETVRDEPTSLPEPGLQLSHELSNNTVPVTRGVLGSVATQGELMAANDGIDLAAAPMPDLPHVAPDSRNGSTGFAADALTVAAVDLDDMRGGFEAPSGLKLSFGIERAVFINGELLATQTINLSKATELAGATGGGLGGVSLASSVGVQSAAVVTNAGGTLVIQNGARNIANLPEVRAALPLVVQNSLDNQNISTVTRVTATVPATSMLHSIIQARRMNDAVIDAVTRR